MESAFQRSFAMLSTGVFTVDCKRFQSGAFIDDADAVSGRGGDGGHVPQLVGSSVARVNHNVAGYRLRERSIEGGDVTELARAPFNTGTWVADPPSVSEVGL